MSINQIFNLEKIKELTNPIEDLQGELNQITDNSVKITQNIESIENNLKAIKLQSNFAPAHNNLAIAYLEKGDYHLAAEHCDKAVELGYQVAPEILKECDTHRSQGK